MLINIHTHHHKALNAGETYIFSQYSDFTQLENHPYISQGIHPWYIGNEWEKQLTEIEHQLNNNKLIAIGECGLDRLKNSDFEIQKQVFIRHVYLSEHYQKPIIIHCVRAYQEIIEIRKKIKCVQPWIKHGFRNNVETAQQLIQNGFYLSFGTSLLKDEKIKNVIQNIPIDRIFFETDDDTTKSIIDVYQKASSILNIEPFHLEKQVELNFSSCFNPDLSTFCKVD